MVHVLVKQTSALQCVRNLAIHLSAGACEMLTDGAKGVGIVA